MNCYRCDVILPEPDLTESIAMEKDWRDNFPDDDLEDRVILCANCFERMCRINPPPGML